MAPNCSVVRSVWLPFVRDKEHAAPYCLCLGACGSQCSAWRSMWLPIALVFGVKEHVAPNCSMLRTACSVLRSMWLPMFCVGEHVAPYCLFF